MYLKRDVYGTLLIDFYLSKFHHLIYHAKFSKDLSFNKNLLETHETMGPQNGQFLQRNLFRGNAWPLFLKKMAGVNGCPLSDIYFQKLSSLGFHICTSLQQIFMEDRFNINDLFTITAGIFALSIRGQTQTFIFYGMCQRSE